MSSPRDDDSTVDQDRDDARTGGGAPSEPAGDLEFDEAWGGAAAESPAEREGGSRDPNPTFEDPNDR